MAQSIPHHFLARASDSEEDFTGLGRVAASAGVVDVAGAFGVSGACRAKSVIPKESKAGSTSAVLNTGTSDLANGEL